MKVIRRYITVVSSFLTLLTGLNTVKAQIKLQPGSVDYGKSIKVKQSDSLNIENLLKQANRQITKPGEFKADLDSAARYLRQARSLSVRGSNNYLTGEVEVAFSNYYRESGQPTKVIEAALSAIRHLSLSGKSESLANAYASLAQAYSLSPGDLPKKIDAAIHAVAEFRKAGDQLNLANNMAYLADVYEVDQKFGQAIPIALGALNIYKAIHHTQLQGIYILLTNLYRGSDQYKESVQYGLLAIKNSEDNGDFKSLELCIIYNRVGLTWQLLHEYNKAILYLKKSVSLAIQNHNPEFIHQISTNLALVLVQASREKDALRIMNDVVKKYPPTDTATKLVLDRGFIYIYMKMRKISKAQTYVNELIKLFKPGKDEREVNSEGILIDFFLLSKQLGNAQLYLNKLHDANERSKSLHDISVEKLFAFRLDTTRHKFQQAVTERLAYDKLMDTLLQESQKKEVQRMEIQYETEKNKQHIQLLEKQSQLQAAQVGQTLLVRNAIIGTSLLLALLLAISFYGFYNKLKANRKLNQQQAIIHNKNLTLEKLITDKDILLLEKEWLVKEIHHRVKNNLQIVISLLNTQSLQFTDNDPAFGAIRESQHRIESISLIHQKLYQSENLELIDMPSYIKELVAGLNDSFNSDDGLHFSYDLCPLELDVSQAVPIGLILNEAITNAVKYASKGNNEAKIGISLKTSADGQLLIQITDNGPGFPPDFDINQCNSLGINLIRGLSSQLKGSFHIERQGFQTRLIISFSKRDFQSIT